MRTNEVHNAATAKLSHGVDLGKVLGPNKPGALTTNVSISSLEQKMAWPAGGWQDKLIRAADQAGNKDGNVTRAELDSYLQTAPDLQFLTSTNMQKMGAAIGANGAKVGGFTGWQGKAAQAADANHDGLVTKDEFNAFTTSVRGGTNKLTTWMPDQQGAALESAVASQTGEADALNSTGLKGTSLQKDYMHVTEDDTRHDPAIVSYTLSAADIDQNDNGKRKNNFHDDKTDAGASKTTDYDKSGYDQGHQRAAEDSVNVDAMNESFLMSNMAPQTPELNRMSWRVIETGVRQLVQSTGATAQVNTGSLFVDSNFKPLPANQIKTIGKDNVQVPTYSFKTVMLQYPDGHKQAMAFVMPNRNDLPVKGDQSMRDLIQGSMMPVSQLENILAAQQGTPPGSVKLYPELTGSDTALKDAPPPKQMTIPDWKNYPFANFIWPQPDSVAQISAEHERMQGKVTGDLGPTLDLGTLDHPK